MDFNVNDIEWAYPVKNPMPYQYKGRTYVIAYTEDGELAFAAFHGDARSTKVVGEVEDILDAHTAAREAIDRFLTEEEKEKLTEEGKKLSDDLIAFGMLTRDESGQLIFTDLGTRTLQCLRMLHGRIQAGKYQRKAAKAPKKSALKRKAKVALHEPKRAKQVKRPIRGLNLRQKGPILNHRLATFSDSKHASQLASMLKKKGIDAGTRNAFSEHPKTKAVSERCHVVVPFSKAAEAVSVLRTYREKLSKEA